MHEILGNNFVVELTTQCQAPEDMLQCADTTGQFLDQLNMVFPTCHCL